MKIKEMYPDYKHSILCISRALLRYYGVQVEDYHLPKLENVLKEEHKNVVFIIFDGMGIDMMQYNLGNRSFLRSNIKDKISSIFPSTTAAATTTYYTGLAPIEHGWLGWAPYFKDLGRSVEIFTNKDYYTGELLEEKVADRLAFKHIFEKIKEVNPNVQITEIFPKKIKLEGAENLTEFCNRIIKKTKEAGQQFILAYWGEPDHCSHEYGPYSKEVKSTLQSINLQIKKMCSLLENTLVIISADHGHIENNNEIVLNNYPDVMDCLAAPLGLDIRTQTVLLKPDKKEEFVKLFNQYFAKDFLLIKASEALEKHLFGYGKEHILAKDFLCDYLIIAKAQKTLVQRLPNDTYKYLKGVHSGLTNKEMLVPLILIQKDKNRL